MTKLNITIVILVSCMLSACQLGAAHTADERTVDMQLEPLFIQSFDESIARVDISDDGTYLLAGSPFEKMRCWSTQKLNTPIEASFDGELTALNFIGKDNSIFFANNHGITRLLTNQFGKIITEYHFPGTSRYSSVSNDTDLIAYGGYIYLRGQDKLLSDTVGHAVQTSLQVGQQNNVLTSGGHDQRVDLRDAAGNIIAEWQLNSKVLTAAMSEDSKYVIASMMNGNCYVWEPPNKKASHRCDSWWEKTAYQIYINKTNNSFVLIGDESISTYQLVPFKKLFTKHIDGEIRTSAISKDNWLALGLLTGEVQLWDILQGKLLATVQSSKNSTTSDEVNQVGNKPITSVAVNKAAKLLMTGSNGGTVALYRIKN